MSFFDPTYQLDWLGIEQTTDMLQPIRNSEGVFRLPVLIPDETGDIWIEGMSLCLGMKMFRGWHYVAPNGAKERVPLMHFKFDTDEPCLHIQAVRNGENFLHDLVLDKPLQFDQNLCCFQLSARRETLALIKRGEVLEIQSLDVSQSLLTALLGESAASALLECLGIAKAPAAVVKAIPPHITRLLHEGFSSHLTGKLATVYGQAKALEYLSVLADYLINSTPKSVQARKTDVAHQVRQELMRRVGSEPTLGELAKRYSLSARTLNDEFKREFDQTIAAFITDQRLFAAHAALSSGKQPLKVLADRLGYAHVNSFINAFTRKFGYPPGSVCAHNGASVI